MDIRKRLLRAAALRSRAFIDERWLYVSTYDDDPYGYRHVPCGPGRDGNYRHSGIDIYDKSRLPQDSFAALAVLMWYHEGGWDAAPAPGDLWRLASIAKGLGDPAGRTRPQPLPKVDPAETGSWVPVIDWRRPPENGGRGGFYSPGIGLIS